MLFANFTKERFCFSLTFCTFFATPTCICRTKTDFLNKYYAPLYQTCTENKTVPPKITPFSFARDLNVGDRTSIQCVVGTGDLPLIFVWLKDGQQIIPSGIDNGNHKNDIGVVGTLGSSDGESAITIRQYDDFTSSLSITSVTRSQGGNYTCKVQNDAAMVWHSALLRVNGKILNVKCKVHLVMFAVDAVDMHTCNVHS